ncbi:MAG: metal ABC transporter substrate-binding protein [Clostridiales bacterium]|jgi:zinc transport system substrate-binding protein|nr:metal ABC transporter substrate-binding protein [Clostridiales bacterium]
MKKKLILVVLALAVITVGFSGCEFFAGLFKRKTDKISVTATIFPCYDFARAVAGDKAELTLLITPGVDIHSYDPSGMDLLTAGQSDVFIYIGGESDGWVEDRLLESLNTDGIRLIRLMDYAELFEEELAEGMTEIEEEEEEGVYDEHIWTSPANAIRLVEAIRDAFVEIDGGNAESYRANAAAYIAEITEIQSDIAETVASAVVKKIVVADKFPFLYLVKEFGLSYAAALPGCSLEVDQASAETLLFLAETVITYGVPVVYYVELSDQRTANAIKESTSCGSALLHSCERLTPEEFNSGKTYADIMRANAAALKLGIV